MKWKNLPRVMFDRTLVPAVDKALHPIRTTGEVLHGANNLFDNMLFVFINPHGVADKLAQGFQRKTDYMFGPSNPNQPNMMNTLLGQATGGKASIPPALSGNLFRYWKSYQLINGLAPMAGIFFTMAGAYNKWVSPEFTITTPAGIAPNGGMIMGALSPITTITNAANYFAQNPLMAGGWVMMLNSPLVSQNTRGTINNTVMFGKLGVTALSWIISWGSVEAAAWVTGAMPYLIMASAMYGLAGDMGLISKKPHAKKLMYSALGYLVKPLALYSPMHCMAAQTTFAQWKSDLDKTHLNQMPIKASEQPAFATIKRTSPAFLTVEVNIRRLKQQADAGPSRSTEHTPPLEGSDYNTAALSFGLEDDYNVGLPGETANSILLSAQCGGKIELADSKATVDQVKGFGADNALMTAQARLESIVHFCSMKSAVEDPNTSKQLTRLDRMMLANREAGPQRDGNTPKLQLTFKASADNCLLAYRFIQAFYGRDKVKYFKFINTETNQPMTTDELNEATPSNEAAEIHTKAITYMTSTDRGESPASMIQAKYLGYTPEASTPLTTAWNVISSSVTALFQQHSFKQFDAGEHANERSSRAAVTLTRSG